MELSRSLLKEFAEVTAVKPTTEKPTYLRGTITSSGTAKYVRIDGSESLTPISEIVDAKVGDRVLVSIENHQATVVGNITKPPSAYKEEEAIAKSEEAKEDANTALEKAETAHTLAQSAGDKADAAVVDATNASTIANQAKQDASEALTAAQNASEESAQAMSAAQSASQNAETAREEAAAAQTSVTAAQGEVTRINGIITEVKGDITTAEENIATQAAQTQAIKETLSVDYAKKTEVSDVQASLTTEISKKVGELQTTIADTYTAKTESVKMEGRLQSQITQTATQSTEIMSRVETLEADTAVAQQNVNDALAKSKAAQEAALQAQNDAAASQTAADTAKADAATALEKANTATQNAATATATATEADRKLALARTDLDEARTNLANTMTRVDATEADILDAQNKVTAAQAAVTQAQEDAAEATLAANNAQAAANQAQNDATEAQNVATNAQKKADNAAIAAGNAQAAADKAQQDVAALTKRVTSAETAIAQNSEQIKLSATKTEEIGTKLDNLQVGGENLFLDAAFRNETLMPDSTSNYIPGHWIKYNNGDYNFGAYNNQINYVQFTSSGNRGISQFLDTETFRPGKEYCIRVFTMWESSNSTLEVKLVKKSSSGTVNWNYSILFSGTIKASSGYSETRVKFTIPDSDDGTIYGIAIVNGSGTSSDGQIVKMIKPKLEEGNTFTDFSISTKDMATQDDLTNNYYSKTQTDAAIKVASDNVTTTVRKETTEQITNINIGERNLLLDSGIESSNKLYMLSSYYVSPSEGIELSDGHGYLVEGKEYTVTCCVTTDNTMTSITGWVSKGYVRVFDMSLEPNSTKQIVSMTFRPTYASGRKPSDNPDYAVLELYRFPNPDNLTDKGNATIHWIKVVDGNKSSKSWSPAPEDMATAEQAQQAQNDANEANSKADATEHRVSVAESTIKQLSDSISMLVTDSNGSSMMTQTSNGWTFNIGSIADAINSATSNIDNLSGTLSRTNNVVNNLNQLANDLSKKTAYINMTTDETGAPCIELGKTGNAFKVRITNTSVDFIEGSSKIAYVSNQALFIEKAIIKSELQVGEKRGFVWKTRSNGNMGIRWFG